MAELHVLDGGVHHAEVHMQRDAQFLEAFRSGDVDVSVCFYQWRAPSITYGHFIDPVKHLDLQAVREMGIDIARRPTGGGILFHFGDVVFTIAISRGHARYGDNVLENYRWINEACIRAVANGAELAVKSEIEAIDRSFCMAAPTIYDICLQGKKIGGSAQRKTKWGYIHQGSLFMNPVPYDVIEKVLLDKKAVHLMRQRSSYIDRLTRQECIESLSYEFMASAKVGRK